MKQHHTPDGIGLICNYSGLIIKVLRDDLGLDTGRLEGKALTSLFDKREIDKVLDFALNVKKQKVILDCHLNVMHRGTSSGLYFTGFALEDKIWMIGLRSPSASLEFINQLQQINNEQANQIRQLIKDRHVQKEKGATPDSFAFDELSRLNNELVNLQRELSKKNVELQRLNSLKNRFLGMAAHDIRNPLGVIMAYSEFLLEETRDRLSEEHIEFINTINSSAQNLLALIEDLLDISHIESGKLNLDLKPTDIVSFAEESISLNKALAAKKNISIKFSADKRPVIVNIDPRKMEQVFNNLLSNAMKFSYGNSEIKVSISAEGNQVLTEVIDKGKGIKPDFIEKLFHPFAKESSEGTAGEKCTGLGLSIVKRIVEGHKGSISAESSPGKGSRFYFWLPLDQSLQNR